MEKNSSVTQIEQHIIDVAISLRHKHKLRQSDLGKIINASPSFIGNVENHKNPAKYNLKHINAMAGYFNLTPKHFMPEKPLINKTQQNKRA